MPFIEAPTTFYLGRRYDPEQEKIVDDVVYYDSRDLVTHAVVVGMTGSGKTGLCITLLEEAVMDNIPAIIIDPKGDITNLMLAFPNLDADSFLPWINVEDAARAGLEPREYAADVAQRWRDGLKSWGIGPHRIGDYARRAIFSIFTPGSDAGLPISIMDALQPPLEGWIGYEELHRERISGIVTALLALAGMRSSTKDREHVLLANIIEFSWSQGRPLSLADIIVQVQQPPFAKLGVFDVNTFYPEKDRFKLAIELNNIIAAPSFKMWLQGEPLDVRSLLYTPQGQPRISIFYIAHLNDAQRSFIITLLLENVLAWMRTLGGTTSLRAIIYFDEVYGHFPPYPKNPPTKEPLLRLLKQARAFGIGVIIATQNPGDLDYKGLSNAGTWFIGKLQTENDKNKVLDGLATAASAENPIDMRQMDTLLSTIQPRVFVMNNVHESGGPILIHTRWAMVYLAGPMTRQEVSRLMAPQKQMLSQPPAYIQPAQPSQQYQVQPQQQYQQPQQQYRGAAPQQPGGIPGFQGVPPTSLPSVPALPSSTRPGVPPPPPTLPELPSDPNQPPSSLPGFGTFQQEPFDATRYQGAQQAEQVPPPLPGQPSGYGYGQPNYQQPQAPQNPYQQQVPQQPQFLQPYQYQQPPAAPAPPPSPTSSVTILSNQIEGLPSGFSFTPPPLSATINQYFLPANIPLRQALAYWEQQSNMRAQTQGDPVLIYRPFLLTQVQVRYADRKADLHLVETYSFHVPNVELSGLIQWDQNTARPVSTPELTSQPEDRAAFGELPPGLVDKKRMAQLEKEIIDYIYKAQSLTIPVNEQLGIYGQPGASFADFQAKVASAARTQRDAEIDKLTQQYAAQFDKMEAKFRDKERALDQHETALKGLGRESLATMGEAAISLFKGRTIYTLSRVSRVRRFKAQAEQQVSDTEAELIELEQNMAELQQKFESEIQKLNDKWAKIASSYSETRIQPLKKDIHIEVFGIGWKPFYYLKVQGSEVILPAWVGQVSAQVDAARRGYQAGQAALQPPAAYAPQALPNPYAAPQAVPQPQQYQQQQYPAQPAPNPYAQVSAAPAADPYQYQVQQPAQPYPPQPDQYQVQQPYNPPQNSYQQDYRAYTPPPPQDYYAQNPSVPANYEPAPPQPPYTPPTNERGYPNYPGANQDGGFYENLGYDAPPPVSDYGGDDY